MKVLLLAFALFAVAAAVKTRGGNDVTCPGGQQTCPDGYTCCELSSGGYGCCPYPNATCCSDKEHCCPNDYTCDVQAGTCTHKDGKTKIPFGSKKQSVSIVNDEEEKKENDVTCPGGQQTCPDGYTCCEMQSGGYGCCPYDKATCCSDKEHCCPGGYTCDVQAGTCTKKTYGSRISLPLMKELKGQMSSINKAVPKDDVTCPGGQQTCPDGYTCCELSSGGYGCCPYPDATCCSDHSHCCPKDYTCDVQEGQCVKKDQDVIPFGKKIPAKTVKQENDVTCPGGQQTCPDGYTCCEMQSGGYGCCPYDKATCCSDKEHCCPGGYTCDVQAGTCTKKAGKAHLYMPMAGL